MIYRSGDHPFASESFSKGGVAGQRRRHQLQRHRTLEPKLGRAVDDSHPASCGYLLDSVAGELRADRKLRCCLLAHSRSH